MRICVISDLHFKYAQDTAEDRQNAELALDFLRSAAGKYDLLVLNGDIFDLWFEWKYTIVKQYFPLLHRLAVLGEQGCRLVLIGGNHDFWFKGFLTQYLGIEVQPDQFALEADGHRILFTHGDLHTVNDLRYKLFRSFIRLTGIRWLFNLLHPDLALSLGRKMSRSSRLRKISSQLQTKKSTGLIQYAQTRIRQNKYDVVCMGHSHKPQVNQLEGGYYVNSGDWLQNHTYVEIIDGAIALHYYKNKE